jgi:DNA-directed RNA polymerase specialized sigma subunit
LEKYEERIDKIFVDKKSEKDFNRDNCKEVLKRGVTREITVKEAMKIMGVSESTYHRIRHKLSDIGKM